MLSKSKEKGDETIFYYSKAHLPFCNAAKPTQHRFGTARIEKQAGKDSI